MSLTPPSITAIRHALCIGLALMLAACGEDVTLEGGGAGDGDGDSSVDLAPFVGIWDITGNWSGRADDEALLVIGELEDDEAEARIYDFDDGGDNCYVRSPITGDVIESIDNRVFLSDLPDFRDAVLSLGNANNELIITLVDGNDIDDDGDVTDTVNYVAPRFTAMLESDLMVCNP